MSVHIDPYATDDEPSHVTPETEFDDERKAQVKTRLEEVLDPCSCMSDHPISIVDLGLVESIETHGRDVEITLLLTSQRCTYFLDIDDEICERVESLSGVDTCVVHQDTSGKIWTNDRMADAEREKRRARFHERMEAAGIVPYAERSD
ncbi:metal-sulfur cluster assembly factor [Salinigranum sp. GCM10025319]|uniref:metal-sulfur cluster assembly factor n=1 Tax=Salinigranum sp. GCM10025319 TaxID=3252687 RepID=UPI0036108F8D